MAYDNKLAERLQHHFKDRTDVETKKMFGGLCFMVSNHMCCGIVDDKLMARVGSDQYEACLKKEHAHQMDFTGRPMKGMIFVSPDGIESDSDLQGWLKTCESFIKTLPPKK